MSHFSKISKADKIDLIAFANADIAFHRGEITLQEFAKRCDISVPPLKKYYEHLVYTAELRIQQGAFKVNYDENVSSKKSK